MSLQARWFAFKINRCASHHNLFFWFVSVIAQFSAGRVHSNWVNAISPTYNSSFAFSVTSIYSQMAHLTAGCGSW